MCNLGIKISADYKIQLDETATLERFITEYKLNFIGYARKLVNDKGVSKPIGLDEFEAKSYMPVISTVQALTIEILENEEVLNRSKGRFPKNDIEIDTLYGYVVSGRVPKIIELESEDHNYQIYDDLKYFVEHHYDESQMLAYLDERECNITGGVLTCPVCGSIPKHHNSPDYPYGKRYDCHNHACGGVDENALDDSNKESFSRWLDENEPDYVFHKNRIDAINHWNNLVELFRIKQTKN